MVKVSYAPKTKGRKMKKFYSIAVLTLVGTLIGVHALAYNSPVGTDPKNENFNQETIQAVKSASSGVSDAIVAGDVLSFSSASDGYTVTRVGAATVLGNRLIACVALQDVATGNTGYFPCVTRGFVQKLNFNASTAIEVGDKLCTNTSGQAVICTACSATVPGANGCEQGQGTEDSGIVALEARSAGSGYGIKAYINTKK
jgi:hypothetical protein